MGDRVLCSMVSTTVCVCVCMCACMRVGRLTVGGRVLCSMVSMTTGVWGEFTRIRKGSESLVNSLDNDVELS